MLIGYKRVSKADGTQLLDLKRATLIEPGITTDRIYGDLAFGQETLKCCNTGNFDQKRSFRGSRRARNSHGRASFRVISPRHASYAPSPEAFTGVRS